MRLRLVGMLMWLPLIALADTGSRQTSESLSKPIEEVVAVGVQPGPKMWRVNKDDHELWIFGTLSPLPKKMSWDEASVAAILADAQEAIYPPSVSMSANPFKGVMALPLLWGVENNPQKQKLVDLLPDELYQRWTVLKGQYIGRDRGIEKHRPIFAAQELFAKAIDESGLENGGRVVKKIEKMVKKNRVPVTRTGVTRAIENPRAQLKKFKASAIDDVTCFQKTIERLEVDLASMRARATAWSMGDMATLKTLPHEDQTAACIDAVLDSAFGSELASEAGLADLEAQLEQNWLAAVQTALEKNEVTFALLPISELLDPAGYLSHLRDKGYEIKGG